MVKTDEEEEEAEEEKEEEGEADVQNRRKKAGGNGWRSGKTTNDDGDMSFLPQTSFIFFKFLEMPNFHFLAKMSDIWQYVQYSSVRTDILSGMIQRCFCTNSLAGMINSGHTDQYDIKLTLNMDICILLHNNGYIKNKK